MKIAVCISGAPKDIYKSIHSVNLIKSTGDVKVFIHTWHTLKDSTLIEDVSWSKWKPEQKFTYQDVVSAFTYEKLQLDCIDERINFLKDYFKNITLRHIKGTNLISPYCMFYSLQQVDKLKTDYELEYSMTFDIVYRMRFNSFIVNPEFLPTIPYTSETLAIPNESDCFGINDQFAYGTSLSMSKYSRCFSLIIPQLNKEIEPTFYNTESFFKYCLDIQGLSPIRTPLRVNAH